MAAPASLDPNLRNQITRFVHTGLETPKYFPGCWTSHRYYEQNKLQALNIALGTGGNNSEAVKAIVEACKDGTYTRFEAVAFALAKCVKLGNDKLKKEAYDAALELITTPEQMLTFNRFCRLLKTGNGRGWCKMIQKWYNQRNPMEMAKEITRVRSRHGYSHQVVLRKAHYKVPDSDPARDAVVKYAIYGLKRAKQITPDKEHTKDIFDYIQKVDNLRRCEDAAAAAALVVANQFSYDHIPGHLLTSQEVWNAMLPQFTLEQLLKNLQRIHNMGFLTAESATTAIVVSMLSNKDLIKKSKLNPLAAYITLCNYKNKSRPMKHQKAKVATEKELRRRTRQVFDSKTGLWQWTTSRRHPKEVKNWGIDLPPCPAILTSLNKLVDQTWLLSAPTKKRYMITLDMRHHMFKGRHFCKNYVVPKKGKKMTAKTTTTVPNNGGGDGDTETKSKKQLFAQSFFNRHVTPGHAAIIVALQLLKREKAVKLAVFTDAGVQVVDIERNFTSIEEAEFQLRKLNLGRVQLDAPIEWAAKNKHKVDVFINMVDRTTRYMELDKSERGGRGPGGRFGPPPAPEKELVDHCPVRALERYRRNLNLPNSKLVVMSLASHRVQTTDGSHEGVLDIVGVDEYIPKVLDAFTLGHFK